MKRMKKRIWSYILMIALICGNFSVINTTDKVMADTETQAETEATVESEWVELGNNDGVEEWSYNSSALECQEITLKKKKVKKLRLYVTEMYSDNFKLHEIEAFDSNGKCLTNSERWDTKTVTLSCTFPINEGELSNSLCNGNGGTTGFDGSNDGNWDKLKCKPTSNEQYIEITFNGQVEPATFKIWTTYARGNGWGNGPKKWKIMGEVETVTDKDSFTFVGDNGSCSWSGDTSTGDFESQEVVLDKAVWTDKIRLKVTDLYGTEFKISEFEAFNAEGVNVLGLLTTDNNAANNNQEYPFILTSDKRKRMNYLMQVNVSEGLPGVPMLKEGEITYCVLTNGENYSNDEHWYYPKNLDKSTIKNEYIEFVFDRPYEIKSFKLWSNYCWNKNQGWGNAPKSWEVWAHKVQDKINEDFNDLKSWSEVQNFSASNGKAVPNGKSSMYSGTADMTDYRLESNLNINSGVMGLTTHYTDADTYYRAVVDKASNKVLLYKGATKVSEKSWPINTNIDLAITVNENKVSVWVDDAKMMDYVDESHIPSGKYGLYANTTDGNYENVIVTPIDVADVLPADYTYEPTVEAITTEMTSGDFYVASNGNDSNSGTSIDSPFKTIEKARAAVKNAKSENPNKNYVVIVRGGTYYIDSTINMTSEDGGIGDYRVTYASYKGETAVLSGGKKVTTNWIPCNDEKLNGVYETTLTDEFKDVDVRQLFVDNSRATRSREPDVGETDNKIDKNGHWTVTGIDTENYQWVTPEGQLPESWANLSGTGVELHARASWRYYRQEVKDFDVANNKVTVKNGRIGVRYSGTTLRTTVGDWLYFENSLEFVDTPGEWYYDKTTNKLYYYPENNANPNDLNMVIPCIDTILNIMGTNESSVKNLDFYGLQFSHTTWYMPDCGRIVAQAGRYVMYEDNETTTSSGTFDPTAALKMKYAERINIQNCDFTMLGEGALQATDGSHSNRIEGCTFTDVGVYGIYMGNASQVNDTKFEAVPEHYDSEDTPRGNVINNNYFNACGATDLSSVAIFCTYANHTTISNNTIKNMPYTGISVGWIWESHLYSCHNNDILNNRISDCMNVVYDGGGIYTLGSQWNSRIEGNYIKATAANNIYLDEGSRFISCKDNYMLDAADIFYHMLPLDELKAYYVSNNHEKAMPTDPSTYGYEAEEDGDANGDDAVDIRDIVRYKRYLSGTNIKIGRVKADLNIDGRVNAADFAMLKTILVEENYKGLISYHLDQDNDYMKSETLVSTTAKAGLDKAKGMCDANYGYGYDSGTSLSIPEEFVFQFGDTQLPDNTKLQIMSGMGTEQGPERINIYVQRDDKKWYLIRKAHLKWQSSSKMQCVEIPLYTKGVTGIKVEVVQANLTWNHYYITEMDLIPQK